MEFSLSFPRPTVIPLTVKSELNVLAPATVCAVVKSTKFCDAEPVPPLATGNVPVTLDVKLVGANVDAIP